MLQEENSSANFNSPSDDNALKVYLISHSEVIETLFRKDYLNDISVSLFIELNESLKRIVVQHVKNAESHNTPCLITSNPQTFKEKLYYLTYFFQLYCCPTLIIEKDPYQQITDPNGPINIDFRTLVWKEFPDIELLFFWEDGTQPQEFESIPQENNDIKEYQTSLLKYESKLPFRFSEESKKSLVTTRICSSSYNNQHFEVYRNIIYPYQDSVTTNESNGYKTQIFN
jgi:hypothetical protein